MNAQNLLRMDVIMKPSEVMRTEESKLMVQHAAGDHSAFSELVRRYRAPVYSYLARCGVGESERDDLFQEIFIRIHKAAASYDPKRELHPWIFTIVANRVRTHLRKRRINSLIKAADPPSIEPASSNPDAERSTAAKQTLTWLEERLLSLPLARREVLVLACIENLPLKDIASVLNMPLGTVKTHLRRARLALAEELAALHSIEVTP